MAAPYRLGRRIDHDPQSRAYAFTPAKAVTPKTVRWEHHGPVLDQGNIGACTGFAMAQWLNTKPAHKPRAKTMKAGDAYLLYSRATQLDPFEGSWEPDDTGSSGLAVCKAAKEAGYITGYRWIFEGVTQLAQALQVSPVLAGTVWLEGMFGSKGGYLHVAGNPQGGHEYLVIGYNARSHYFTILNSWGDGWQSRGTARIREMDMAHLLAQRGDLVVPSLA
jgi:hypothetical protein